MKHVLALVAALFLLCSSSTEPTYFLPLEVRETKLSSEYKERLAKAVDYSIETYGVGVVDHGDVWATLKKESTFNHYDGKRVKRGGAGEWGAMQVKSMWASNREVKAFYRQLGIELPKKFDLSLLEDNISCGVTVLAFGIATRTVMGNGHDKRTLGYTYYNQGQGKKRTPNKYARIVHKWAIRFREEKEQWNLSNQPKSVLKDDLS